MTRFRLLLRSLQWHWRANLAILLGVALTGMVIAGALYVGDSTRFTQQLQLDQRLGGVRDTVGPTRLLHEGIADEMEARNKEGESFTVAPVLALRGSLIARGQETLGNIHVYGVEARFWTLGNTTAPDFGAADGDGIAVNRTVAEALNLQPGDSLALRVDRPGGLNPEALMGDSADATAAGPATLRAVVEPSAFGDFSMVADRAPPRNVFVPLHVLQRLVDQPGKVNLLLASDTGNRLQYFLASALTLEDYGLTLTEPEGKDYLELGSLDVFIPDSALYQLSQNFPKAEVISTYFVNGIEVGGRTPYSMVSAVGELNSSWTPQDRTYNFRSSWYSNTSSSTPPAADGRLVSTGLPKPPQRDEIVFTDWLAKDLEAKVGDTVHLEYFIDSPGNKAVTSTHTFAVSDIVPLTGPLDDPSLMPPFPGLDTDNCRDWDTSMPVDMSLIRDKDEAYWDAHRGAPKAWINLDDAMQFWSTRFGSATAMRIHRTDANAREALTMSLRRADLVASPVQTYSQMQRGIEAGTDLGGLFVGLSFFLVAAALLLVGLMMALAVRQRGRDLGLLGTLGLDPGWSRRTLALELALLTIPGALLGVAAGTVYNCVVIGLLAHRLQAATGLPGMEAYAAPKSAAIATGATIFVALLVVPLSLYGLKSLSPLKLLQASDAQGSATAMRRRWRVSLWLLVVASLGLGGLLTVVSLAFHAQRWAVGLFFGSGFLLLVGGLALVALLLARLGATPGEADGSGSGGADNGGAPTLLGLALRNLGRTRGRALALIALLAAAVFLVVAVGANRQDPFANADDPRSGTGGFTWFITLSQPLLDNPNTKTGREALDLDPAFAKAGLRIVPLRVRPGDDASCLNVSRATRPAIWGVDPLRFDEAGRFTIIPHGYWSSWANWSDGVVGDANTLRYNLGVDMGDNYPTLDLDNGANIASVTFTLKTSILQGALLMTEEEFTNRYPEIPGYRILLVDVPPELDTDAVREELAFALADHGPEFELATHRLGRFLAVENTYLAIFQALGLLAVALGSLGLALIVARNVLERRHELAMLRAIGFPVRSLALWLTLEHAALLALGLLVGSLAAFIAVLPTLLNRGFAAAGTLALTLLAMFLGGILWTWLASRLALRAPPLAALRDE